MGDFYNVDGGLNTATPWFCPILNDVFADSHVAQGYTEIIEVPHAINTGNSQVYAFSSYWELADKMKTKFSTSRRFFLTYEPIDSTLKVIFNGEETFLFSFPNADHRYIDVVEPLDGYLRVSYVPSSPTAGAGNTVQDRAEEGLLAAYRTPIAGVENVVKARRAINKMEVYLGMQPSSWVGGIDNTVVAGARNLMAGLSHINAVHFLEMQHALDRLYVKLGTLVNYTIPELSYTTIDITGPYRTEYIEDVLTAVNALETVIIVDKDTILP